MPVDDCGLSRWPQCGWSSSSPPVPRLAGGAQSAVIITRFRLSGVSAARRTRRNGCCPDEQDPSRMRSVAVAPSRARTESTLLGHRRFNTAGCRRSRQHRAVSQSQAWCTATKNCVVCGCRARRPCRSRTVRPGRGQGHRSGPGGRVLYRGTTARRAQAQSAVLLPASASARAAGIVRTGGIAGCLGKAARSQLSAA